jgi:hypothetical protein
LSLSLKSPPTRTAGLGASRRAPAKRAGSAPAKRPGSAPAKRPSWIPAAAVGCLAVIGIALFSVPLRHVSLDRMDAFGLISVLPRASLGGLALLVLAFVLALGLRVSRPLLLGGMLVAIVIALHGVTSIIESQPRFPTTYQIGGFTEFVGRTGRTAPGLDAYFSWPGFFALTAFVKSVVGANNLLAVMRFWPLAINLAYLVPMWLFLRNMRADWRAKWFAALLFTIGLWVGQDYFSPQSFDYLLYLLFVAIAVTWFRGRPGSRRAQASAGRAGRTPEARRAWQASWAGHRLSSVAGRLVHRFAGRFEPGELPARQVSNGQRAVLLTVLIGVFAAITVSHQLTPALVLVALAGLVLARRSTLTGLPILLGVILVSWLSFAATGYWSGHLADIFGAVGHLGGNVSAGVGGRLAGASRGHELLLYLRVGFAIAMFALAGLGLLRRRRRLIDDRAALVLTCVPFISLGLQSYGGEILLRVYMFSLPAACVLAAYLFFPRTDSDPQTAPAPAAAAGDALPSGSTSARAGRVVLPAPPTRRSWPALIAAAAIAIAMAGGFLVTRYGNEAFEQTPRGVLAATNYIYAHDRAGARVLWLTQNPPVDVTPEMPWLYRDIEKVRYQSAQAPANPAAVGALIKTLRDAGPHTYVITTTTQEAYLEQVASYRPGWGPQLRDHLSAAPGVRTVFANRDASIYTLQWPRGTPTPPLIVPTGVSSQHSTPWTPIGLIALGLLLIVLPAREYIRVSVPAAVRFIRPLTLASLPLIVLLLAVVVERFIVMS